MNDPVLADTIWESGLNQLFSDVKIRGKVAVGLNPNIRFYRLVEFSSFRNSCSFTRGILSVGIASRELLNSHKSHAISY